MSLTIGQRLKKAREERYLTLEKAAHETRIRTVFLKALESDDYSAMPSAAQGRGFLRNYASYLDINIDEVVAEMQRNAPPPAEVDGPLPQVNLVETDFPSLAEEQQDEKPRPFWTSWFARRPKAESMPEGESTKFAVPEETAPREESPAPVVEVEVEKPKPRGRKKKDAETESPQPVLSEATESNVTIAEDGDRSGDIKPEDESLPVDVEQVEVKKEAKPGLFAKLASLFQFRVAKSKPVSIPEIEETSKPLIEPANEEQVISSQSAGEIFVEIGKQLRERREMISLTVEEVERHTRLRAVFVKALEEGAFDKLPSTVQTRGMLANYSTFLDLDTDAVLLRFADALQARHRERYSSTPRERIQTEVATSMPLLRGFIAGDLIFGVLMIVVILALAVWGLGRVMNSQRQANNVQATAPSIVDVLAGSPQPTPSVVVTFLPANDLPIPTGGAVDQATAVTPTLNANANVTVSIFAVERTFVRVSVDGKVAFEGRIAPRETQVYEADNQVVVLTGNAAALRINYNGHDLGLMGNVGEVVSRVYLITGVATPTATIPPTPTSTPLVTGTPTPTFTPTPTLEETTTAPPR